MNHVYLIDFEDSCGGIRGQLDCPPLEQVQIDDSFRHNIRHSATFHLDVEADISVALLVLRVQFRQNLRRLKTSQK